MPVLIPESLHFGSPDLGNWKGEVMAKPRPDVSNGGSFRFPTLPTGETSRLSPISGCGLFHQRGHTQQITHSLSNRFGNNSRDAANRTLPRLPVQPQIASDSRHLAFVHVNPRNTQQLSRRFALPYTFGKWRSRLRLSVRWRASNRCSIRP